ncbi:MAG TPA: Ig-like domain-containing protein, partial [Nitrospiria bacterium]|nr:Ig-like domain-containing protein [Nitrospiria bacterium]
MKYRKLSIGTGLLLVLFIFSYPFALTGDTVADIVLGQLDFTHNAPNLVDGRGLYLPFRVAVDKNSNRIFVADDGNNRVLSWPDATSFQNGDAADVVIGQPDFSTTLCNYGGVSARSLCLPRGVGVDNVGNLYVADTNNHRVLEYDAPFTSGMAASRVFGQGGSFTLALPNNGGPSAGSLDFPNAVGADGSGNLYVVDQYNNRVLEYDSPLTDQTADRVIGQANFSANKSNRGQVNPAANSLSNPFGVALDGSGNLYVADVSNNRVLEYNAPISSGMAASRVFGQTSFTSFTTNADNAATASTLRRPYDVVLDSSGNLYVADNGNWRVLEYTGPLADNVADRVFGQGGSFSATTCVKQSSSVSASTLCTVTGVGADGSGNIYIVDPDNNRVLGFNSPVTTDTVADRVLGQANFSNYGPNYLDGAGFLNPSGVAVDRSVRPNHIYVADTDNSRVLAWNDVSTLINGQPADIVIGQPDFYSAFCNQGSSASASTLCNPRGIAVDSAGNLYVADNTNNRVLVFNSPFTTDTVADQVIGHSNFTDVGCNFFSGATAVSANSLCNPTGVAFDPSGNLYVSDFTNNRVLEYNGPPGTGAAANQVFGQPDFSSNICDNGGISASSLCNPSGVALDSSGNLYVADLNNNRVLEYTSPLTDNVADQVFGQAGDFTANVANYPNISATSLSLPRSVAVDGLDDLYIADTANSRVLEFDNPLGTCTTCDTAADMVFGQPGFGSNNANYGGLSASSMYNPYGLAVGDDLYVADTANHRMLVIFIDLPPVVTDQDVTTPEDTPVTITLSATDPDSPSVTFSIAGNPPFGTLSPITGTTCTPVGDGTSCTAQVTYTPILNYNGPDSFLFKANDGLLDSNIGTVNLTVTPVNDPPVADDQAVTTAEEAPITITLSASDVDNTSLAFAVAIAPHFGTLSDITPPVCTPTPDGLGSDCTAQVTYSPNTNYFGSDLLTFTANDGLLDSNQGSVPITVTPVEDPPTAADQPVSTPEDTAVVITLKSEDVDGDPLTYLINTNPANGTLSGVSAPICTPQGLSSECTAQVTYTPNPDYNGPDSFSFTVNDGQMDSNVAVVSLTVVPVNDPPVATGQSVTTAEDTPVPITFSATDIDSPSLTFVVITPPSHGSLGAIGTPVCTPSGAGSSCTAQATYTPAADYNGSDSFTFGANDGTIVSTPAAVSLTITPVNDPPVSQAQSVTTPEEAPLAITLTATDIDSASLTFALGTAPTNGTLSAIPPIANCTVNGAGSTCTAQVTYTPNPNYNGPDSFTFTASDGLLTSSAATVSVTVTPVNDPPTANAQSVTTSEDTAFTITLSATDIDSTALTFATGTAPTNGTLGTISAPTCTPSGGGASCTAAVTYTPNANYNGPDSFTFTVNDGTLASTPATVSVTVTPVNDPPTANAQSVTTPEDQPLVITLSATDIDSTALTNFAVAGAPTHGTLGTIGAPSCTPSGAGTNCTAQVTYTPTVTYNGPDSFSFTVSDGSLTSTAATVSITVTPVNDPPTADAQSVSTAEDTPITITLAGADIDSAALTFSVAGTPAHGSLGTITGTACTPSGLGSSCTAQVTYTPNLNYNGPDSFTFISNDGSLNSTGAAVSVTITPVNDAPVSNGMSVTTAEGSPVTITLSATDVDNSALAFILVAPPTHGTLGAISSPTCTPSGLGTSCTAQVTYTPNPLYNGPDSFTYKANDVLLDSNVSTVSLTVTPVNDPPTTTGQSVSTAEDTAAVITLSAADVDSASLTFTVVGAPTHGTLGTIGTPSCTPSGLGSSCTAQVTYTPNSNYNGTDSFTFKANDTLLDSNSSTVNLTITAVNDAPVSTGQTVTTPEDAPVTVTLSATDVDSATLTFSLVSPPTHGSVGAIGGTSCTPSGLGTSCTAQVTYTPAANYNGPDSFTYKTNDGFLDSTASTVSITVTPVNNAPVSNAQSVTTAEDTALAITLAASDIDSPALTFAIGTPPAHGSLSAVSGTSCTPSGLGTNCTALVTYTPALNYNGPDTFTFTASDGLLPSTAAAVSITVTAVNDAPVAVADSATVSKNS